MDPKLLPFALQDVPRYTSYPTAVQFQSEFSPDTADEWLSAVALDGPLSAYVNIPFCRQVCWYCGSQPSVPNAYERAVKYVDCLNRDIGRSAAIGTVAVGMVWFDEPATTVRLLLILVIVAAIAGLRLAA